MINYFTTAATNNKQAPFFLYLNRFGSAHSFAPLRSASALHRNNKVKKRAPVCGTLATILCKNYE